jgi:hypothetical protein
MPHTRDSAQTYHHQARTLLNCEELLLMTDVDRVCSQAMSFCLPLTDEVVAPA